MTASYDAVLFDLDGVLTSTAALHQSCWKRVFDDALADWTARTGEPQEPSARCSVLSLARGAEAARRAERRSSHLSRG
jgi:beta-phosphoglucomutase-like phosphatase (HAD superfamily)